MRSKDNKRVLYISPDGLMEPLGDSQVLKYLENLALDFQIELISFEKAEDLNDQQKFSHIQKRCSNAGINWHFKKYRKNIFLISQLSNMLNFLLFPLILMARKKIAIVHIRSYMPGLTIPLISLFFNFKFIFDIRGFWADEKHDRLGWSKQSAKYKFFKQLEIYLFRRADAIVTLTNGAKKYIQTKFNKDIRKIFVIRTCVDFQEFQPSKNLKDTQNLVIGYLGTIDTAYNFDSFLALIKDIKKYHQQIEVRLLTKATREDIEPYLIKHNIQDINITNQYLRRDQLRDAIIQFDLLAFCLKENFSILASMPTKIGESLACGIPILCNSFNEDIEQIITSEGVGEIYDFHEALTEKKFNALLLKIKSENISKLCSDFSQKEFSLDSGTLSYKKIYQGI